jgi:hypothetical protein
VAGAHKSYPFPVSGRLPACPTCKATVTEPDRVYKVTAEPEQGERGIVKRDVGMFRCQRCDTTFPRVLGRIHYLLVPENEHNRMKKEIEDDKKDLKRLDEQLAALRSEKTQREESLAKQIRDGVISSLEGEIRQLEKNVKQLKSDKDKMKAELAE